MSLRTLWLYPEVRSAGINWCLLSTQDEEGRQGATHPNYNLPATKNQRTLVFHGTLCHLDSMRCHEAEVTIGKFEDSSIETWAQFFFVQLFICFQTESYIIEAGLKLAL